MPPLKKRALLISGSSVINVLCATVADAFEVYGASQYGELLAEHCWCVYILEALFVKINNSLTFDAPEMLVPAEIAVEPLCVAGSLDHERRADIAEGQQGPVDGVKRDVRKSAPDAAEDHLGRGMVLGLDQGTIDRRSLWCYAKPGLATIALELTYPCLHLLIFAVTYHLLHLSPHGFCFDDAPNRMGLF
jgi:hypothetical protein